MVAASEFDVQEDAEKGDSENMSASEATDNRPSGRARRTPATTGSQPVIDVDSSQVPPGAGKPREMIIAEVVTELVRVAQDLTFQVADRGVSLGMDDLGATLTRVDVAARVQTQASRLVRMITPRPENPEPHPQ